MSDKHKTADEIWATKEPSWKSEMKLRIKNFLSKNTDTVSLVAAKGPVSLRLINNHNLSVKF